MRHKEPSLSKAPSGYQLRHGRYTGGADRAEMGVCRKPRSSSISRAASPRSRSRCSRRAPSTARCSGSSTSPSTRSTAVRQPAYSSSTKREATTAAASRPFATEVAQLQIEADEGPCLDAATRGLTLYADDLIDDPRWPNFATARRACRSQECDRLLPVRRAAERAQPLLPAARGVRRHRPRPGSAVRHPRPARSRLRRGTRRPTRGGRAISSRRSAPVRWSDRRRES